MKNLANQKGYTLLIVLFLIVFIMTVTAVFMRGSISNAKQEEQLDKNHLTVMAAEAGVDYLSQALINEYYSQSEGLNATANKMIENTPRNVDVNYNAIYSELERILRPKFQNRISRVTAKTPHFEEYTYRYKKLEFSPLNNRQITLTGWSEGFGVSGGKNAEIEFELLFEFPDYEDMKKTDGGSGSPSGTISFNPPNITEDCKSDDIDNKKCKVKNGFAMKMIYNSTVHFPFPYFQPNGNLDVRNSALYSSAGMSINNFNQFRDSTASIIGSVFVNSNMKMERSNLYINGAFHSVGNFTMSDKSTVCVSGNIDITGKIDISNGSKLFYAIEWNKENNKLHNITNAIGVPEGELWTKCGGGEKENNDVEWEKPVISKVKYH